MSDRDVQHDGTRGESAESKLSRPKVLSFRVGLPPVKVTSCFFSDESTHAKGGEKPLLHTRTGRSVPPALVGSNGHRPAAARCTRLRPPRDLVRLEDRLLFLLQPPLERLFQVERLDFPFEPFPYQLDGIAFLYARHAAVLADEMGLGKTMQAITTIRLLARRREVASVLLVCPKPLVTNWQREFALWAPEIPTVVIRGGPVRRRWMWQQQGAIVKIANYELLLRDGDYLTSDDVRFDLVVLDEAQRIKNRRSSTHTVVKAIERSRAWALTGTPVENSTDDLVGIFDFLMPGYLSTEMNVHQLGEASGDFILRRTKDGVLSDLPPKLHRDARIQLTAQQWETYRRAEDEGVLQLESMGEEVTIHHVFELVLRLKQICNFDPASGESAKAEQLVADLEEVAASGQKAIVFSQWVQTLERLADRLAPFGVLQYHGRVPMGQRDAVIERFRRDDTKHVLLMSYGAGSVGLNLQFATYVFLFDRWWNPAVEDQAINRAHRIGAAGPVTVTRMMAEGTIEERIHEVLEEKRQLIQTVFSHANSGAPSGLTQEAIFGLFNLGGGQSRAA